MAWFWNARKLLAASAGKICMMSNRRTLPLRALSLVAVLVACVSAGCSRAPEAEVSDQEKIAAAADYIATTTPPSIQVTDPFWEGRPSVPYANGKELMAYNPGCCRIGQHTFEVPAPKCHGEKSTLVTVMYGSRYVAPDGSTRRAHKERILAVNSAGRVCGKDEY